MSRGLALALAGSGQALAADAELQSSLNKFVAECVHTSLVRTGKETDEPISGPSHVSSPHSLSPPAGANAYGAICGMLIGAVAGCIAFVVSFALQ